MTAVLVRDLDHLAELTGEPVPYILPPAPRADRAPAPRPRIRTRHVALLYLPTVGVWSVLRAIRFYTRRR